MDRYGSEYHLRRYLNEEPTKLNTAIEGVVGDRDHMFEWLPFGAAEKGDRELRGIGVSGSDRASRMAGLLVKDRQPAQLGCCWTTVLEQRVDTR